MFNDLLNWGVLSMGLGIFVYCFRGKVKRLLLTGVINGLKAIVVCHRYLTKKSDSINPRGVVHIDDGTYIIHEYDIVCNNKLHEMCFISEKYDNEKVNKKLLLFNENKEEILAQRYKFLYCSLVNKDRECIKDITDDMRTFMFYFKQGSYVCNVEYVLKYLKYKYSDLDINDCDLLLCMNDDDFTEKIINLNDKEIHLHKIIEH